MKYLFGDHIDTSKTGPLKLEGVELDPKGYAITYDITTQEDGGMYLLGRYAYNPNDAIYFAPNLNRITLLLNKVRYEVKDPLWPAGTRLRFRVKFTGTEIAFYRDGDLIGSAPCDDATLAANFMFGVKTHLYCSRVVFEDHQDTVQHDFRAVDGDFVDTVGSATATPANYMEIKQVHAITYLEDAGKLAPGQSYKFEASPGFAPTSAVLGSCALEVADNTIHVPIGDVDNMPHIGKADLTFRDDNGAEFTLAVEVIPPPGWDVLTYADTEQNELSLTYQIGRHPQAGNQLLFQPSDDVAVDKFNVLHPQAENIDRTFYFIDKGGMKTVRVLSRAPVAPRDDLDIDLAIGETVHITRTEAGLRVSFGGK